MDPHSKIKLEVKTVLQENSIEQKKKKKKIMITIRIKSAFQDSFNKDM